MTAMTLQGTPEWLQARCGRVTASRIADVVARTKAGWGAARATYMGQLLAERLTGQPQESFVSPAMRWGSACEDQARAAYEYWTDQDVSSVGFVSHASVAMSGASPDGLVGQQGLVELKCPTTVTHIDTVIGDEVPPRHLHQIQWQLACTGRAWCDFVSFDPRLPEILHIFIRRVHRDDGLITELEGSQNRISVERRNNQLAVQHFNVDVRTFPRSLIAGLFGFHPYRYFEATSAAQSAPQLPDFNK